MRMLSLFRASCGKEVTPFLCLLPSQPPSLVGRFCQSGNQRKRLLPKSWERSESRAASCRMHGALVRVLPSSSCMQSSTGREGRNEKQQGSRVLCILILGLATPLARLHG